MKHDNLLRLDFDDFPFSALGRAVWDETRACFMAMRQP